MELITADPSAFLTSDIRSIRMGKELVFVDLAVVANGIRHGEDVEILRPFNDFIMARC